MSEALNSAPGVASPCIGVCRLTGDGFCEGCLRITVGIAEENRLLVKTLKAYDPELSTKSS